VGTERGFTFIEVLVVMVVLSFGVLGVLQATLLSARLERQSQAVTTGTLLAQERLESIGALGWDRATSLRHSRLFSAGAGPGCRRRSFVRAGGSCWFSRWKIPPQ
jgi:prepilin-type N-terminal cleavage/methylation domain-containing protein